ncbi:MAG: alpha/beta fold hydrolase [bacterium]|nr:alpha/beta fold hydrolase [bacterium]
MSRDLTVPALDGYALPATLWEREDARTAVVVSPATATPRRFYRAFCDELAARGAAVIAYDYRGTFEPPATLRRSDARMRDWGERDFAGVVAWMRARYPHVPLAAVGHSVGGHVLLMAENNRHIARAVTVASQSGYWPLYRGFERYRVFAFVKTVMPLLTRLCGYFPGERVVFGTNLAPGVLYEWSRWCTTPGYFVDDPEMREVLARAATFTAPTLMIGLDDDPWATPQAIDALRPAFTHAPIERVELRARDASGSVGHMGFFRSHNRALWERAFAHLILEPSLSEVV